MPTDKGDLCLKGGWKLVAPLPVSLREETGVVPKVLNAGEATQRFTEADFPLSFHPAACP